MCLCLSVRVFVSACHVSIYLSVCLSQSVHVFVSVCPCVCVCLSCVYLPVGVSESVCPRVYLPACVSKSVHVFIYLSVCLSVHVLINLSLFWLPSCHSLSFKNNYMLTLFVSTLPVTFQRSCSDLLNIKAWPKQHKKCDQVDKG
jgi:hypothetical protein